MTWSLVDLDQVPAAPWRNGGGVTRELLAWPSASNWRVRVSVADIDVDGPFSRFDGVERGFAVLEGAGVLLSVAGVAHRLAPGDDPLVFSGSDEAVCRLLDGPTRDFNLMAPPGRGRLRRIASGTRCAAARASLVALYAHRGPARLGGGGSDLALPARHLAWQVLGADAEFAVRADDAFWLEVRA